MGRLNVFITIDTEVYPRSKDLQQNGFDQELRRDVYGATPQGEFGINYQMGVLNSHGLKGGFFVEVFFAYVYGFDYLSGIVGNINDRQHDVQLHLHTSWLKRTAAILPGKRGHTVRTFNLDDQTRLIGLGVEKLKAAGADKICAFRAGDYGADFNTLRALARNGLRFDTSHNACALDGWCDLRTETPLLQPRAFHGVYEFPITVFEDYPNHYRHAQLTACSSRELDAALLAAWARGWYSFVIVSHSFELVKRSPRMGTLASPDRIAVRRFERLCRFLAQHQDKFRTTTFSELDPAEIPTIEDMRPLKSNVLRTGQRMVEQLARKWL